MAEESPLRGACSCGRNQYLIFTPFNPGSIQVLLDERPHQDRSLSLRVPLSHIRSTTYAFYPDETHHAIRRVFTPPNSLNTKRHFCGFCGTHLTYWTEENEDEAEWVCVGLGSLKTESLERLRDAGFLSSMGETENRDTHGGDEPKSEVAKTDHGTKLLGTAWYEEMIEGSKLGRIKRRRGGQSGLDGRRPVEWEVMEFLDDEDDSRIQGLGKRKIELVGNEDDVEMKGTI